MCQVELCDRVEISRTDRSGWSYTDTFSILSDFTDTLCEELTIPLSDIFEMFREVEMFENIASLTRANGEGLCDDGGRMIVL
jgi:hypothetical protein